MEEGDTQFILTVTQINWINPTFRFYFLFRHRGFNGRGYNLVGFRERLLL